MNNVTLSFLINQLTTDLENSPKRHCFSDFLSFPFLYPGVVLFFTYLFRTISILIHALLHPLIFTVLCVCFVCMVHHCTWACYLPATLLGLAVGQNILRALTFPGSPTPPSSPLSLSPSVSHPRICQSGPGQSACCPPAISHLLSHPLLSSVHPFPLFLFLFSSPSLCISLSHIFLTT